MDSFWTSIIQSISRLVGKRQYAGLDLSDRSAEFVAIETRSGHARVVTRRRLALAPGLIEGGVIQSPDVLASVLRELFADPHLEGALDTTIGLNERQVFSHHLSLKKPLAASALKETIFREAALALPIDFTTASADFSISQETPYSFEVIVAAAKHEVIKAYRDLTGQLNGQRSRLEPESLALIRSVARGADFSAGGLLIVDLGSLVTNLFLVDEKGLQFSATLNRGGDHITTAIAEKFHISFEEAENRKVTKGFGDENLFLILQYDPQLVLREIERCVRFYEQNRQRHVTRILLAGGGAQLPGLLHYMSTNVDKSVLLVSDQDDIVYSVALGLALAGLEDKKQINLFNPAKP